MVEHKNTIILKRYVYFDVVSEYNLEGEDIFNHTYSTDCNLHFIF